MRGPRRKVRQTRTFRRNSPTCFLPESVPSILCFGKQRNPENDQGDPFCAHLEAFRARDGACARYGFGCYFKPLHRVLFSFRSLYFCTIGPVLGILTWKEYTSQCQRACTSTPTLEGPETVCWPQCRNLNWVRWTRLSLFHGPIGPRVCSRAA